MILSTDGGMQHFHLYDYSRCSISLIWILGIKIWRRENTEFGHGFIYAYDDCKLLICEIPSYGLLTFQPRKRIIHYNIELNVFIDSDYVCYQFVD